MKKQARNEDPYCGCGRDAHEAEAEAGATNKRIDGESSSPGVYNGENDILNLNS